MSAPPFTTSTYELFEDYLAERIKSTQHLTEDSVRYSFFCAAIETTDIKQHEIILELPHPDKGNFKGKEIDTHVLASDSRPEVYIEFKFHRRSKKSNSSSPRPLKAGSLFKDFSRLSSIKTLSRRCFVIYLTDDEMSKYFENQKIAYSDFWNQRTGDSFNYDKEFMKGLTDTALKASEDLHRAKITVVFSSRLGEKHHLRVFEISEI
jgi:hypothetical protein